MKIKKKNTTIPINGKIVDTENVEDTTSNAPSLRLVEEMIEKKVTNFASKVSFTISDTQTKEVEIELNKVYIFINSHTYKRCMLFLTTCTNSLRKDIIFKSTDDAVPTITMDGNVLKIVAQSQMRGSLFKIEDISCV